MREFIYGYEIEAVVQEQGNARLLLVQNGESLMALKTTTTNNDKDRAQFRVEIECLKQLDHPNIISVLDVFDDPLGFSMPYIVGDMLVDLIERESLSAQQILTITISLFKALEHTHGKGILHCDLKPNNVICTEERIPILLDFGLAQLQSKRAPLAVGSTQYMPPEVIDGKGWSTAGEIYALGLICRDMLEHCQQKDQLDRVQAVVDLCLQVETADRPASCSEVLKLLEASVQSSSECSDETVGSKNTSQKNNSSPNVGFSPEQKIIIVLLVLVLIGISLLLFL